MTIKFIENFQEPTRSTIVLNNISVVDHAYIDDKGCVRGGSFNPNFIVSGQPDPTEKVVVDFSTIKKGIKKIIDAHEWDMANNGFDHKVWIIEGYSLITSLTLQEDKWVRIETPNLSLNLPSNAVRIIAQTVEGSHPSHSLEYIGRAFATHVQNVLEEVYPNIGINVQCVNTVDEHITLNVRTRPFHYVHGLKDSTSFGCQNIAHGHRSFIHVNENDDPALFHALMEVASELDDTVFVRADNITEHQGEWLTIKYTSGRGMFEMKLNTTAHKVVVLPTETTVEFLTSYVKKFHSGKLKSYGATNVYVSEGLSKGSVEEL